MKKMTLFSVWLLLLAVHSADAQQSLQLEGTEITGNKELPQVLYIVPWKTVQRFDIKSPPINSILEQKLEPIDRASFKRSIHYHQAIFSKAAPATPVID
jgi:hypothetical protein